MPRQYIKQYVSKAFTRITPRMRTNNKSLHIISPSNDSEYTIVGRTHRLKLIQSVIECQQDAPQGATKRRRIDKLPITPISLNQTMPLRTPYVIDPFLSHNSTTTIKFKFRIVGIIRINCSFDFSCHSHMGGKGFFFQCKGRCRGFHGAA